jgi:transcriptional regulator with XRE-family HTH domain
MSQTSLGNKIDVTFQQIQKYEKGKNAIPSTRLAALATALNVSIEQLFDVKSVNGIVLPPPDISVQAMRTIKKIESLSRSSRSAVYKLIDDLLIKEGKHVD